MHKITSAVDVAADAGHPTSVLQQDALTGKRSALPKSEWTWDERNFRSSLRTQKHGSTVDIPGRLNVGAYAPLLGGLTSAELKNGCAVHRRRWRYRVAGRMQTGRERYRVPPVSK